MVATENDSDMCKIEFARKDDFRAIFPSIAGSSKKKNRHNRTGESQKK